MSSVSIALSMLLLSITSATAQTTTTTTLPTLESGWYFIRAVAEPNYHNYLQTKPTGSPSPAYLDTNTNAGQFNVIDGQLVYHTGADTQLYMNVATPVDSTQRTLETWFNETMNEYGTFAFQGDALTWSVAGIARPNVAAWYVCEEHQLYINLGAYLYQTPDGCADQTIHSYGGSTPDV